VAGRPEEPPRPRRPAPRRPGIATVTFKQNGSCLTGTLTDSYIPAPGPQSGPISGTIRGNTVTFSFTYPTNVQGKRTYTGTISSAAGLFAW
jgi:hypothetical protein